MLKKAIYRLIREAVRAELNDTRILLNAPQILSMGRNNVIPAREASKKTTHQITEED